MLKKVYGLPVALFLMGLGLSCAGATAALAVPGFGADEGVTVDAPYTIRQQALTPALSGMMQTTRISIEKGVSYADLDLSKEADRDTMKIRIRQAARENCRELNRRFPQSVYIPLSESDCVRASTAQGMSRLEKITGLTR